MGQSLTLNVLAAVVAGSFASAASGQQSGGLPDASTRIAVLEKTVFAQQGSLANLQTLVTALQSALVAETQQRIAAQQALQAAIAQETMQRTAADTALQSALNTEATIRQSTDQALANSINIENKIDLVSVSKTITAHGSSLTTFAAIECPDFRQALAGGIETNQTQWMHLTASYPNGYDSWAFILQDAFGAPGDFPLDVSLYVICGKKLI